MHCKMEQLLARFFAHAWLKITLLLAIISLGILTYFYIIEWQIGYSSDTALIGLMGKAIAEHGERPIFVWSVGYQGMFLEAYLVALFFRLFGVGPLVLNLAPMVYLWLGLAVWTYGTAKVVKPGAAVLGLIITIFSMPMFYQINLRTMPNYPEALLLGGLLLICFRRGLDQQEQSGTVQKSTLLCGGFLVGFCLYTFAVTGYFLLAIAVCVFIMLLRDDFADGVSVLLRGWAVPWLQWSVTSPAPPPWKHKLAWVRGLCGWLGLCIGALAFVLNPPPFIYAGRLCRWEPLKILAASSAVLAGPQIFALVLSRLRKSAVAATVIGWSTFGFILGYSPALYHKLILGGSSIKQIGLRGNWSNIVRRFDIYSGFHAELTHSTLSSAWPVGVLYALAVVYFIGSNLTYVHRYLHHRTATWPRQAVYAMLPPIVLAVFLCSGLATDVGSTRFLVLLIPIYAMMLGHFIVTAWSWNRWMRLPVSVALLAVITSGLWELRSDLIQPQNLVLPKIREALEARGLHFGYADYWLAYGTTFLANEEIILEPIYSNYAPQYGPLVKAAKRIAYLDYPPAKFHSAAGRIDIVGQQYRVIEEVALADGIQLQVLEKDAPALVH